MLGLRLLLGCDTSNNRVEKATLSQQTLMEMFLDGIENKERICLKRNEPEYISEWKGLVINEEQVVEIDWDNYGLKAHALKKKFPTGRKNSTKKRCCRKTHKEIPFFTLSPFFLKDRPGYSFDLQWIPDTVQRLVISNNDLAATLGLEKLPISLTYLDLRKNKFSGEVILSHLPELLSVMCLSYNKLNGSVNLSSLPSQIRQIYLENNDFVGKIDFSQLPNSLQFLDISNTRLSGDLTIELKCFRADNTHIHIVAKTK